MIFRAHTVSPTTDVPSTRSICRANGKAGPAAGVGENPQNPGFSWLQKPSIYGKSELKDNKTKKMGDRETHAR